MQRNEKTEYEKFVTDRGWEFNNEEALRAAFSRKWKAQCDILLTEEEFIAEAKCKTEIHSEQLKTVYCALVKLVNSKKLSSYELYNYASNNWCLRNSKAIVDFKTDHNKWEVNNCDTLILDQVAKVDINQEWGFEVSRIKIIGTPYYDATDWQFIRFDCAQMRWLWKNGNLYQVYD